MKRQHTISVLVENEFGVLARVAGLFSIRGFNIESLCVAANPLDPSMSRITLVTIGDDAVLEQVTKQLNKLVSVVQVQDFQDVSTVDRELVLIRVAADEKTRSELMNVVDIFRAKIVDVSPKSFIVEITGTQDKIDAMIELLRPLGIEEVARTGKVAMARGMQQGPGGAKKNSGERAA